MPEVLLRLPDSEREAYREPLGPVLTEADELLAAAGDPLVAVGDVVTAHLRAAGREPDVAVVDGRTQRGDLDPAVAAELPAPDVVVANPPATLSRELLAALADALADARAGAGPTTIEVDGEEDLATLPALLAVPAGASVVYGHPGEGMVHVRVDAEVSERAAGLFDRLDGDHGAARAALGVDG